jgi:hypothetical protein
MKKTARQLRKEARLRDRRIRSITFTVLVVIVLGVAGLLLKQAFFRPAPPPMAGNVIDLEAT